MMRAGLLLILAGEVDGEALWTVIYRNIGRNIATVVEVTGKKKQTNLESK